jgi:hypothetical protein
MAALAAVPLGRAVASAQTALAGTSPALGVDAWVAPRTADGQPDLQGLWNNTTITPFERRAGQPEFITEEDAVAAERSAIERRAQANAPSMPRTELLPAGANTGSVNQFWFGPRFQIVGSRRSSLVIDPPDGRVPLRSEAEARRDYLVEHRTDSVENMSVYSRCITRGVPGTMFPQAYNNGYQILQIPGFVVIRAEMMHVRVIPLDAGPHIPKQIRGWMGDSRGHWDGDTLIVETTNFDAKGWISSNASAGRMHGVPQSDALGSHDALDSRGAVRPPTGLRHLRVRLSRGQPRRPGRHGSRARRRAPSHGSLVRQPVPSVRMFRPRFRAPTIRAESRTRG